MGHFEIFKKRGFLEKPKSPEPMIGSSKLRGMKGCVYLGFAKQDPWIRNLAPLPLCHYFICKTSEYAALISKIVL